MNLYLVTGIESDSYIQPGWAVVRAASPEAAIVLLNESLFGDLDDDYALDPDTLDIERLVAEGEPEILSTRAAQD